MDTSALVNLIINNFKKAKPSWIPPHKIIYSAAKKFGFEARIDGLSEKTFDKEWEERFEAGTLENDDCIKVLLRKGKESAKLCFISNDLQHIELIS